MNAELRAIKTAAEQGLAAAYAAARATLPGKGPVAALREDAFKRFEAQGLPHRRVEEWKYTDLRALMREAQAAGGAAQRRQQKAKIRRFCTGVEWLPARLRRWRYSSRNWSDSDPHDPGITIGELFALAGGATRWIDAHMGKVLRAPTIARGCAQHRVHGRWRGHSRRGAMPRSPSRSISPMSSPAQAAVRVSSARSS